MGRSGPGGEGRRLKCGECRVRFSFSEIPSEDVDGLSEGGGEASCAASCALCCQCMLIR